MRARCCALAALALSACAAPRPPRGAAVRPERGVQGTSARAPLQLEVKRYPGGEPHGLASDRGSVVLLEIWATWCEACRDALPFYERLAREYGLRGLKVYALNVDEDPRAISAFLAETKVELPILHDPRVAESLLEVRRVPTTFLLDRQGVVRHVQEGFSEALLAKCRARVEALLAEPAR